jgi:ADP-ribose pyrophosphatase YjhB (NUDIX family)
VIAFDDTLRQEVADRLRAHPRRQLALERRGHAAVAVVLVDSDAGRHDVDPVQEQDIEWAEVPGYPWDAAESARLDGRMVGVAGGAAFLLCRRPSRIKRHASQYALPGGRIEAGEAPLDAALRETAEELGLRLSAEDVVGWLDDRATRSGFVISPVVLWGGSDPTLDPDPREVIAVYRVGLQALLDCEPRFTSTPQSRLPVLQLPLGNDLIHPPTGALLYQFREVALRGRLGTRVDQLEEPGFAWR